MARSARFADGVRAAGGSHMKARASQMTRTCTAFGIALALGCAITAQASPADDNALLFGNWGGWRPDIAGVQFDFGYVGESAHNFSGGTKQMTEYTDQWSFGATLDLNHLV